MALSDFPTGRRPATTLGDTAPHPPGSPPNYSDHLPYMPCPVPGGSSRCLSVSSPCARPSPNNRRVGIHNFTFEACSGFTRVTACRVATRPRRTFVPRLRSSGYPSESLGSFHVSPTTTWVEPPSTDDLRRWGALLFPVISDLEIQANPQLSYGLAIFQPSDSSVLCLPRWPPAGPKADARRPRTAMKRALNPSCIQFSGGGWRRSLKQWTS